ncbi:hypothetical protein [Shewanella chilikensis]|uniref:hypothetical protein n=1 Tax=Shewanella chilikensis TaxID=558541 RepID=UPI001BF0E690|nr:hypothetical protein TUM17377_12280 [Shewanella chilikensis]
MEFESRLFEWINQALADGMPPRVKAFNFNLFETGPDFGIELIGSSEFDEADSDWACEEVFEPKQRQLRIPLSYSGGDWEQCLESMKAAIQVYLQTDEPGAAILHQAEGIGIGFVDGDLELVARL